MERPKLPDFVAIFKTQIPGATDKELVDLYDEVKSFGDAPDAPQKIVAALTRLKQSKQDEQGGEGHSGPPDVSDDKVSGGGPEPQAVQRIDIPGKPVPEDRAVNAITRIPQEQAAYPDPFRGTTMAARDPANPQAGFLNQFDPEAGKAAEAAYQERYKENQSNRTVGNVLSGLTAGFDNGAGVTRNNTLYDTRDKEALDQTVGAQKRAREAATQGQAAVTTQQAQDFAQLENPLKISSTRADLITKTLGVEQRQRMQQPDSPETLIMKQLIEGSLNAMPKPAADAIRAALKENPNATAEQLLPLLTPELQKRYIDQVTIRKDTATARVTEAQAGTAEGVTQGLQKQGVTKEALFASIYQQESSSGKADTSKPNYAGAYGPMQVTLPTFNDLKNSGAIPKDYDINNPAHSTEAGKALINQLWTKYGGEGRKVAAAYYAGPKAVNDDGTIADIADSKNSKAPTARQYADQVLGRIDSGMKLIIPPQALLGLQNGVASIGPVPGVQEATAGRAKIKQNYNTTTGPMIERALTLLDDPDMTGKLSKAVADFWPSNERAELLTLLAQIENASPGTLTPEQAKMLNRDQTGKSFAGQLDPSMTGAQLQRLIREYNAGIIRTINYDPDAPVKDFGKLQAIVNPQGGNKTATKLPPPTNSKGWKLMKDKVSGDFAYVSPNGKDYDEIKKEEVR